MQVAFSRLPRLASGACLLFSALFQNSCASTARVAPAALSRTVQLVDGATAEPVAWETMFRSLADQDVVFFGETHDDQVTHSLELATLEELYARRKGRVVLAMEMFERDQQSVLDDYLAGRIDEATFYASTRTWGNYRAGYRPLIEFARAHDVPVVAANAPVGARRKLTSEGYEGLTDAERALVATKLWPNSDAYWARFDAVMAGHGGGGGAKPTAEERLRCGQSVWDNTMAESVVRALAAHPGHTVLLVVGRFHVEQGDGTAQQVSLRREGTRSMTLIAEPVESLDRVDYSDVKNLGNYVALAERRARIVADREHVLRLDGELRYTLHVPRGASTPLPWYVWLPDAGDRPADARARLAAELREDAAFLVFEGPLPVERADLARGNAWTHPDSREASRERLVAVLLGALQALPDAYPVDRQRLVLAGAGEGALLAAELKQALPQATLMDAAVSARDALALSELPSEGELCVLLEERDAPLAQRWAEIFVAARGVDATRRHRLIDHADLAGLASGTMVKPLHVAGASYAAALRSICPSLEIREAFGPQDFENGRALPLAAGAFGGMTVLWVPGNWSEEDRAAWSALEAEKAIAKRSSFAKLKVCFELYEPSLQDVVEELADTERKSALVVPAVFAANSSMMNAMRAAAGAASARMALQYLPGLGSELHRVRDDSTPANGPVS